MARPRENPTMSDQTFQTKCNNIIFSYSSSEGFTAYGHTFDAKPKYDIEKPIEFWKAQLAFRGFSPRGNSVKVLKERLRGAAMDGPDDEVRQAAMKLIAAHKATASGTRKRKADDDSTDDRRENAKRAPAKRKELAESAKKRMDDRLKAQAEMSKRVKERIHDRYKEAAGMGYGGEGSSRSALAQTLKQTAIESNDAQRKERVINRRMAENNPEQFLRGAFFDEYGRDVGYPPAELKNLCSADRAHLHQACDDLRLFHETTVTSVMVIGSGKNTQGQQRLKQLNRAAGWPPIPYVPDIDTNGEEEEESEDASEEASEVADEDESDDGDNEPSEEPEEEEEQEWDITGYWEIKCPRMAGCFGQHAPYTLEIFSTQHRVGRQIYGRFDFGLGAYKGVFRLSSQQPDRMGNPCKDDIEEFLLPNDIPSAENPTIFYRWRGREGGENVIQLGSEADLYQMTFSDGGRRVTGTWGSDRDPGTVNFSGVKIGEHGVYDSMNIQYEWGHLNEATYDNENRDRWRNRY